MRNFYRLYDEINAELKKDKELTDILNSKLDETCYPDPELCTMTFDVGFYISRYMSANPEKVTSPNTILVDDDPGDKVEFDDSKDTYTKKDFLKEVYMTESRYNNLVGILRSKKNIILQGHRESERRLPLNVWPTL